MAVPLLPLPLIPIVLFLFFVRSAGNGESVLCGRTQSCRLAATHGKAFSWIGTQLKKAMMHITSWKTKTTRKASPYDLTAASLVRGSRSRMVSIECLGSVRQHSESTSIDGSAYLIS